MYQPNNGQAPREARNDQPPIGHPAAVNNQRSEARKPAKNYSAEQVRHFSKNTAIQVSLANTRSGELPTLMLQLTSVKTVGGGKEKIGNWKTDSLYFQIEPDAELLALLYFLNGKAGSKECTFSFHGEKNNKKAQFKKNDDGTMWIGVNHGSRSFSVVIPPPSIVQLLTIAYKAYARRFDLAVVDAVAVLNVAQPVIQSGQHK